MELSHWIHRNKNHWITIADIVNLPLNQIIKFIDTDDDLKLSTKKLNYIALSVISELLNLKSKNMAQVRNEIYDSNGLVRVEYIEVDEPTQEELIAQKEAELLAIYAELQALKGN